MSDPVVKTVLIVGNNGPTREPSDVDIAWMAGLFEGEGTCRGTKGRTIVCIFQKDPEILFRCREFMGGNIQKTRALTEKYLHVWNLYGDNGRRFLQTIYPFMSTRRKLQIEKSGGLRLTGSPQGREHVRMTEDRSAARRSMTTSQKAIESALVYRQRNREKVLEYQRRYSREAWQRKKQNIPEMVQ